MLFRRKMVLSVLTERRAFQPYGMAGGEPGSRGKNLLQRNTNNINKKILINLGSKTSVEVNPGVC